MRNLWLIVALCSISIPFTAVAQPPTPSDGIPVPDRSISTQSDSASLEVNPAGLGFIQGSEASIGWFSPRSDYDGVITDGFSFLFGAGGDSGGVGVGFQWVNNPALGPAYGGFRKTTFGAALSPGDRLSLGINHNRFGSRDSQRLNNLSTTDLGAQLRLTSRLSTGVVGRDFRASFLDTERALPRRYGVGLAAKAFSGRLFIDTEFQSIQDEDAFWLRPRLSAEFYPGLRFFTQAQLDLPHPDGRNDLDLNTLSVGWEVSFGDFGLQAANHFGQGSHASASTHTGTTYRTWAGTTRKRPIRSERGRWIEITLDESVTEQATNPFFGPATHPFMRVLTDIEGATEDASVDGVVLRVERSLSYSQGWELHQAMEGLHDAGKDSLAIMGTELPSTSVIYAASAANSIWMRPSTPYAPTGLHSEFTTYARLFDRLGVQAEFIRIGDYKSAPEIFVEDDGPTDAAREQTAAILDDYYDEITSRIAQRRDRSQGSIESIIDNTPLLPYEALEEGLIDDLVYDDDIKDRLRRITGSYFGPESGYSQRHVEHEQWGPRPEIAVVYVDGTIISGESTTTPFGSSMITGAESILETLDSLRRDRNVKAVVVRIDSPGGSAVGSDMIFRALRNVASQKPVIASMGGSAASGGYYVAAGADEIIATPLSLTGSIGIFAGKFNVGALADRIGIATEEERRGDRAGAFSIWQPWSEGEREGLKRSISYLYDLFLQQVATTRPLTPEQIDEVARGRVWTGKAARDAELVDREGSLLDALRRAEEVAGLTAGEAEYVDRTGRGGSLQSVPASSALGRATDRLGLFAPAGSRYPGGQWMNALQQLEADLLWPFYFNADEPLFVPAYPLTIQ